MFDDIGGKIKGLATFICWVGIIVCVILGIVMIVNATGGYRTDGGMVVAGILIIVIGSLLSWVGSFVLYGFGELVENSTELVIMKDQEMKRAKRKEDLEQGKQDPVAQPSTSSRVSYANYWKCPKCGKQNPPTTSTCLCGGEKPVMNTWTCPKCAKRNPNTLQVCVCGTKKPS